MHFLNTYHDETPNRRGKEASKPEGVEGVGQEERKGGKGGRRGREGTLSNAPPTGTSKASLFGDYILVPIDIRFFLSHSCDILPEYTGSAGG